MIDIAEGLPAEALFQRKIDECQLISLDGYLKRIHHHFLQLVVLDCASFDAQQLTLAKRVVILYFLQ
jgi:hypothetical protein